MLPREELVLSKALSCNSMINRMDYESARSAYNTCILMMKDADGDVGEKASSILGHSLLKLESYRHIHDARKHIYYKNKKELSLALQRLDKSYSDMAYNIGFLDLPDKDGELRYLRFVAMSKEQIEKFSSSIS